MKKFCFVLAVILIFMLIICVGCKQEDDDKIYVIYSGASMNTTSGITTADYKIEMKQGTKYSLLSPAKLVENGKKFVGWSIGDTRYAVSDSFTMGDKSVTYTAVWKTAYSLTFVGGDGTQGSAPATAYYAEGEIATLPACTFTKTEDGWRFDYWQSSINQEAYRENATFTVGTSSVTFTAQWTQAYRIIFEGGGQGQQKASGQPPFMASRAQGEVFALPQNTFSLGGYDFDGWLCDKDNIKYNVRENYTMSNSDVTFTAQWKETTTASDEMFTFALTGENDGYIISKKSGATFPKNVVLPATFNQLPILQIAEEGFKNGGFSSVTIPASVTSIGNKAFYSCSSLTTVILQEDNHLTSIGEYAFWSCKKLSQFGTSAQTAKTLNLPDSMTTIPQFAFFDCAFSTINIGENVSQIGDAAFAKNINLTTFSVNNANTTFGGTATTLTNKDNTVFYAYALASDATSFDTADIQTIKQYAFYDADKIVSVTVGNKLTKIEQFAFAYCDKLKDWVVSNEQNYILAEVAESAFSTCINLVKFYVGKDLTTLSSSAFEGCNILSVLECHSQNSAFFAYQNTLYSKDGKTLLFHAPADTSFVLPDEVETIAQRAFQYNTFKSFPVSATGQSNLTTIQDFAFYGCLAMETINLGNNLQTIGQEAFSGCSALKQITFGANLTTISKNAFNFCKALTSVTFDENCPMTQISEFAFSNCGLTSITFPKNVTTISNNAFSGCASLALINFNNVTTIQAEAFLKTGLISVTITKKITSIADTAFAQCLSLQSYIVADDNPNFTNHKYENPQQVMVSDGNLYNKDKTILLAVPFANEKSTDFELKNFVTEIGSYVFWGNPMLSFSVEENSQLTTIGQYAFADCYNLDSVILPSCLTTIEAYAFKNCNVLASVTFDGDQQLQTIGEYAFADCIRLVLVLSGDNIPTDVAQTAFYVSPEASTPTYSPKIKVPQNLVTQYKTQWSFASNYIEKID